MNCSIKSRDPFIPGLWLQPPVPASDPSLATHSPQIRRAIATKARKDILSQQQQQQQQQQQLQLSTIFSSADGHGFVGWKEK